MAKNKPLKDEEYDSIDEIQTTLDRHTDKLNRIEAGLVSIKSEIASVSKTGGHNMDSSGDRQFIQLRNLFYDILDKLSKAYEELKTGKSDAQTEETLRLAVNAGDFIAKAQEILGCPVQVISGEEEARLIYQGVAHTTGGADQRLVVDIGGASTELVTGTGAQTTSLFSLSMGCVTWLERYFADRNLGQENFDAAEKAAREVLRPVADELRYHGWKVCVGASGTVQALQEIMMAQGMDERITLEKLQQLKQRAIHCGRLEELEIDGLTLERALVFPSGLAILIAIFTELNIQCMTLAGGALREGLVYGMLHLAVEQDIRSRTLRNIQRRFMIDIDQAQRVAKVAANFFDQVENEWHLEAISRDLLISACQLHEIGLSVDFKQAPQHAAYLVRNLDLPGFTPAQKKLLATLLLNQTNPVDLSSLHQQNAVPPRVAEQLCRLLRLAIIFASRRRDDLVPEMTLQANHELLTLTLPQGWLTQHPLGKEIIAQESQWQSYVHWPLEVH